MAFSVVFVLLVWLATACWRRRSEFGALGRLCVASVASCAPLLRAVPVSPCSPRGSPGRLVVRRPRAVHVFGPRGRMRPLEAAAVRSCEHVVNMFTCSAVHSCSGALVESTLRLHQRLGLRGAREGPPCGPLPPLLSSQWPQHCSYSPRFP